MCQPCVPDFQFTYGLGRQTEDIVPSGGVSYRACYIICGAWQRALFDAPANKASVVNSRRLRSATAWLHPCVAGNGCSAHVAYCIFSLGSTTLPRQQSAKGGLSHSSTPRLSSPARRWVWGICAWLLGNASDNESPDR